jgi:hypothetical protein
MEEQEMEIQIRGLLSSEYRESIKMGHEEPDEEEEGKHLIIQEDGDEMNEMYDNDMVVHYNYY